SSFPVPNYFHVATYRSNVDNLESFNDDSAVTELNSENNGHGNPNEDDVVLSEGSNFGDEGRRLTKENCNDPFQAKTSSGSDLQSNFRSSNTRFSTLSWASSSRSKPASEYLRDQSAAKFPRLARNNKHLAEYESEQKQSDPLIPIAPVLVGTSWQRGVNCSKIFPRTFVATGPPVPFLMLPFAQPPIYLPSLYPWDGPGKLLSSDLHYTQMTGHNPLLVTIMPFQPGSDRA
ncbi:unnamed protein product, partial [Musa textilis]